MLVESLATFSMWLTPKMILVATFAVYVLSGGDLTPPTAFAVVSLFSYIQFYLQFLPNSLSVVIESYNAIKRIERFLMAEEINRSCITHSRYEISENRDAIIVENGNFFWDKSETTGLSISDNSTHLTDLNFSIRKGDMVAVVGDIGSGKSSLIYSLLGEMKYHQNRDRPRVTINGSLSLVTQKPWIVNDTVRNNIVFGK
jgi:ATP-binding cassette subfamily C (CFTR/MRP) protein 1